METPLLSRRITRSQASIINNNNEGLGNEESNTGGMKSRKHQDKEKSALIDITNGSPIVGLAMGSLNLKTPSSRGSKKRMIVKSTMTPGSGESLLRGQVKTLLQKETGFDFNLWCNNINNTPQVCNFLTGSNNLTQKLNEGEKVEKNVITRSLFSDFSENDSDSCDCNSLLMCQDSDASMWSVRVNASSSEGYEDELCEGMNKISVNNGVKFTGKHIRFVYNSDGELEEERGV